MSPTPSNDSFGKRLMARLDQAAAFPSRGPG